MTAIRNFIAEINLALSSFFFYYGNLCLIILCSLLAVLIFIMLYRANKCKVSSKSRYKYKAPDSEIVKSAADSLSHAVSIETTTGNAEKIKEFHKYLQEKYPLSFSEIDVDEINGGSLLFRWKGSDPQLPAVLFAAHMDVVPADGEWSCPPFLGVIKDDKIYGRGTVDCKNVLIGLMESAEHLLAEKFQPKRDIYFAFGHDEETGGTEGAAIIARLLEKRGVNIAAVLDEGGCIINGYMGSRNAAACVYVSEKCKCNVEITAKGGGGHASTPGKHTVIGILSEAICRIEASPNKRKMLPLICEYFKKSAGFMPFYSRFLCANLPFTKPLAIKTLSKDAANAAMMKTTAAATVIRGGEIKNVLSESASVNFDVRLLPGDSRKKLIDRYEKLLADLPCSVDVTFQSAASNISEYNCKAFALVSDTIKERFGNIPVIPSVMNGGSDARYYEKICASVYRFMPFVLTSAQEGAMHGNDECIPVASLGAGVEFYIELMKKIGSCDEL